MTEKLLAAMMSYISYIIIHNTHRLYIMSKDISCLHEAMTSTCAVNLATKPEQHLTSDPEIREYRKLT